jgi:hypothetical protein
MFPAVLFFSFNQIKIFFLLLTTEAQGRRETQRATIILCETPRRSLSVVQNSPVQRFNDSDDSIFISLLLHFPEHHR